MIGLTGVGLFEERLRKKLEEAHNLGELEEPER